MMASKKQHESVLYIERSEDVDKPRLIGAQEVAERLRISKRTAYEIIKGLNDEIAATGKRIRPGRVDERFFEQTYFTADIDKAQRDGR